MFEHFCREFLHGCWFFKERSMCPWCPLLWARLLSFSMFLLFHVCDCNTPLVTHFKIQIKQVIQLEMVGLGEEGIHSTHACPWAARHCTAAALHPSVCPRMHICRTICEWAQNQCRYAMCCVEWADRWLENRTHCGVWHCRGFCCFVYLVFHIFCMYILLRNTAVERCTVRLILQLNLSSVTGWHTGITTACESVSPFSVAHRSEYIR